MALDAKAKRCGREPKCGFAPAALAHRPVAPEVTALRGLAPGRQGVAEGRVQRRDPRRSLRASWVLERRRAFLLPGPCPTEILNLSWNSAKCTALEIRVDLRVGEICI